MRSLKMFWRHIFSRRHAASLRVREPNCIQEKVFASKNSTEKPEHCLTNKEWRLLAHINCASPVAKLRDTYAFDLDGDLLERIDFLACLLGSNGIR